MPKKKYSRMLSVLSTFVLSVSLIVTPLQSVVYAEAVNEEVTDSENNSNLESVRDEVYEGDVDSVRDAVYENPNDSSDDEGSEYDDEEWEYDETHFEINLDYGGIETTSNSITIHWEATGEVEQFELLLDDEVVDVVSGDVTSYTFTDLNVGEEYIVGVSANGYYTSIWEETYWSDEELIPVSLITIVNEDPSYDDKIRIRGLEDGNKEFYRYVELYFSEGELYLPPGKLEVTLYDDSDPSISAVETIEIKEGEDYLSNPIQLKFKLKEMREEAEPFEYEITNVSENSFTIRWNEVSKIRGFEISGSTGEYSDYHDFMTGYFENNVNEFTVTGLNPNLIYYAYIFADYVHDLEYNDWFNLKTLGEDVNAPKVNFAEEALQQAVAKELGIYLRDVTEADMEDLRELFFEYNDLETLEGLEYAKNLENLYAYGNEISDLTTLENLKQLQNLDLDSNNISDISALEGLSNLTYLSLNNNNISDVSAIKDLTNLNSLNLYGNEITNIDALANLTYLSHLDLDNNSISDITALQNLTNLESLDIYNNQIIDIEALANLEFLEYLGMGSNNISDISSLANLSHLYDLSLYSNNITNIDALANLVELEYLNLDNNNISDISALKNLTKLYNLNLYGNDITNIDALGSLSELEYLDLDDNNISDISALEGLDNLIRLDLSNNPVTDISVLKELSSLQEVYLYGIEITDMDTIQELRNDGVEVYFDGDYGDWNDWEDEWEDEFDEEDRVIDMDEVLQSFPEDSGFVVSEDGKSITLDVSEQTEAETFELTTEQTRILIENNQTLTVKKDNVETAIPASSFDNYDEPVTIDIVEQEPVPNSFSSTYDFTIKQGTRTISQFGDPNNPEEDPGITLTFNVNAERANNPQNLKVFYYNEDTGKWENIGGEYSNGKVTVVTYHFSMFTVFEVEENEEEVVDGPKTDETNGSSQPSGDDEQSDSKGDKAEKENEAVSPEKIEDKGNNDRLNTSNDKSAQETNESENTSDDVDKTSAESEEQAEEDQSNELPGTATNMYNMLAVGGLLVLMGIAFFFVNRRMSVNK